MAWERSAFGFLIGGALPLLGQGAVAAGKVALAVLGALLAMSVVWLGRRRAHRMPAVPRLEVLLLGWATAGFAALIVVFSLR